MRSSTPSAISSGGHPPPGPQANRKSQALISFPNAERGISHLWWKKVPQGWGHSSKGSSMLMRYYAYKTTERGWKRLIRITKVHECICSRKPTWGLKYKNKKLDSRSQAVGWGVPLCRFLDRLASLMLERAAKREFQEYILLVWLTLRSSFLSCNIRQFHSKHHSGWDSF